MYDIMPKTFSGKHMIKLLKPDGIYHSNVHVGGKLLEVLGINIGQISHDEDTTMTTSIWINCGKI